MKKNGEIKVCLVGSSGGHLTHLYMLKPFWKDKNRFWVTFDKEDARSLLEGEKVYPCYFPTNRSIKALIKNTKIAWDVLHKEKPDLIISCGAAVAVPFFYIGKMMGAKLVYIEVFDRIDKPTMTEKMVYVVNQGMQEKQSITVRCVDIEDLEKQAEAIRVEQIKLYESYADGVLLRDAYIEKKKVLSEKLAALQDSIRTEKEEQECADELDEEIRALTKQASEKTYIGGLTKECVDAFVSMVYLYDDQTMKIEFNCEDVIRRAMEKYPARQADQSTRRKTAYAF